MLIHTHKGFTLIEVLITMVILAFGLLGLANLQTKLHMTEMESYQRSQALVMLQDFASRLEANGPNAAAYVTPAPLTTGNPLGTGNTSGDCAVSPATRVSADRCAWHTQLLGAAEVDADGNQIGGVIGARGCVEQMQAPNNTPGVCTPGTYRISVAWQGLFETSAPALACGQNQYGGASGEARRRVISTTIIIGLPKCT